MDWFLYDRDRVLLLGATGKLQRRKTALEYVKDDTNNESKLEITIDSDTTPTRSATQANACFLLRTYCRCNH